MPLGRLEEEKRSVKEKINNANSSSGHKSSDPYNMLREIYLDHNSKVITFMMPESDSGNASSKRIVV